MKYLLCIDGSPSGRKAADKALSMVTPDDSLIFLSVYPPTPLNSVEPSSTTLSRMMLEMFSGVPDLVDAKEDQIKQIKRANKRKSIAVQELQHYKQTHVKCQDIKYLLVASNEISDAITNVAEKYGADTVVLGSRGLGSIKRMLLGSVSSQVLQMSHCSVLIVR
ncbi:hypothetical protein SAMD00019534_032510, partial [Acytostelium subglobosum LB1]|uniref:hypothetical protein n=1 Tax=Acytostelium subglobosum LB1 TaxID=1410327 RepID=UPI000644DF03